MMNSLPYDHNDCGYYYYRKKNAASGGTREDDCSQPPIFYGDESVKLWSLINKLKGKNHDAMYLLGCKLQELEARIEKVENVTDQGRENEMPGCVDKLTIEKDELLEVLWGICLSDHLNDVMGSIGPLVKMLGIEMEPGQEELLAEMKKLDLIPEYQRD